MVGENATGKGAARVVERDVAVVAVGNTAAGMAVSDGVEGCAVAVAVATGARIGMPLAAAAARALKGVSAAVQLWHLRASDSSSSSIN